MASRRAQLGYILLGLLIASLGLAFGGPLADVDDPLSTMTPTDGNGSSADGTGTTTADDVAIVTFRTESGETLGEVRAMVADSYNERYTGLSDTDSLGPNEGMVFVYPAEGDRTYVMRDMDFPLDMIFVGSDGRITAIYHAPVEGDSDLTRYSARAKWVIEVNEGWTTEHDVSEGDLVRVDLLV